MKAGLPSGIAGVADGWTIERHVLVDSTQRRARELPAWSAVIAESQQAGRGQQERSFVSDGGGLYLTAVVPVLTEPGKGRGFSLAVGWAVRAALLELGVRGVRLRWPNDVMIGSRKVGGILIEQAGRDTLLVGLGLNVTNQPWLVDPTLRATATSLQGSSRRDGSPVWPSLEALVPVMLRAIRQAHAEFEQTGLAGMVNRFNASWGAPRAVELELNRAPGRVRGEFRGITSAGDVEIATAGDWVETIPAHHVSRLREIQ